MRHRILLGVVLVVFLVTVCWAADDRKTSDSTPSYVSTAEESVKTVIDAGGDSVKVVADVTGDSVKAAADIAGGVQDWFERDILSGPTRFVFRDVLDPSGLTLGIGATQVYQQNIHGGLSTHRRAGRYSGSYDLELAGDLRRLLGIDGGFYVSAEGSWSRSGGIDTPAVGSTFGVNADGAGRRTLDLTQAWYEGILWDGAFRYRIGKMDMGGGFDFNGRPVGFDGNAYANDETAQFLNGALVNNPTIPFPDCGLGFAVYYQPTEWWYVAYGMADAQADARETGFRTAFHGPDHFFHIAEAGVATSLPTAQGPLPGACRFGIWYDPQDKETFDTGATWRDDWGLYISADQLVCKENEDSEDTQGLGVFGRYGWADSRVNEVTNFWSLGLQYQGLLEGRDDDVLALGLAQGIFSDDAGFSEDDEWACELYYSAVVTENIVVSPSLQYIVNPGGDRSTPDALVLGVRMQASF